MSNINEVGAFASRVATFSDAQQSISVPFFRAEVYLEMSDDAQCRNAHQPSLEVKVFTDGQMVNAQVPSNYGCVFIKN